MKSLFSWEGGKGSEGWGSDGFRQKREKFFFYQKFILGGICSWLNDYKRVVGD